MDIVYADMVAPEALFFAMAPIIIIIIALIIVIVLVTLKLVRHFRKKK